MTVDPNRNYVQIIESIFPDRSLIESNRTAKGSINLTSPAKTLTISCPELTMTEATIIVKQWLEQQPQILNE